MGKGMNAITFADFVAGQGRSGGAWVKESSGMRLYVRRAIRVPGGFELACIEVPTKKQRKGILTRFLAAHSHLPLKIEQVLNSDLERWLCRNPLWFCQDKDWIGLAASFYNGMWRSGLAKQAARAA